MRMLPTLALLLGCAALSACKSQPTLERNPAAKVAFTGFKLFDGAGDTPVPNAVMVIENGRILAVGPAGRIAVPKDAAVVDLSGKNVMPGLISNHNHVGAVDGMKVSLANYNRANVVQQLRQYERYGVTTATALGVNADLFYEIRRDLREGRETGADLFGADRGIGYGNGAPPLPKEFSGPAVARVTNAQTARERVRTMKTRGADLIKIWVDDFLGTLPKMPGGIYRAVIDEAHQNGLRVAAHVYYAPDALALVRADVDILAHGIREGDADANLVRLMKEKNVAYVPTLGVDESFYTYAEHPEWLEDPFFVQALSAPLAEALRDANQMKALIRNPATDTRRRAVKTNQKNTVKLFKAGVLVGFGTDSGANPWRIPGWAEHRELELLVQAGLTPLEAIRTATFNAAQVLGLEDRGALRPGRRADFIVLAQDPAQNILHTRSIEAVYNAGRKVERP